MIFGMDTDDRDAATAALLVYAVYRSRDRARFKVTPGLWPQAERFTKAAAKRAVSLPDFLDRLKPRFSCDTLDPRALAVGVSGSVPLIAVGDGSYIEPAQSPGAREFGVRVLADAATGAVLFCLYRETSYVILLVRDRLERERPLEARFETTLDQIGAA